MSYDSEEYAMTSSTSTRLRVKEVIPGIQREARSRCKMLLVYNREYTAVHFEVR